MTPDPPPCDCCGGDRWSPLFNERGHQLGQCSDCDLLYIDRMPSLQTRMTEMEGGHFAGGEQVLDGERQAAAEKARTEDFRQYLAAATRHAGIGRWLDIGCGGGHLLTMAQELGYQVEGIELTTERRELAQRRGITVHSHPIEDLGLPTGSFEVISMIDVFSHLTSPLRTFTEIRRLLSESGVLVLVTGEARGIPRRQDLFTWNLGDHLCFLGARTLRVYAQRTGFTVKECAAHWLPDLIYSRSFLQLRGRSTSRNLIKKAILTAPGGLWALRQLMLRRQRQNALYSVLAVLAPTDRPISVPTSVHGTAASSDS